MKFLKSTVLIFITTMLLMFATTSDDSQVRVETEESTSPKLVVNLRSPSLPEIYTGSVSCRECHEKFYKLWASSHHGLAMQPYNKELASTKLSFQEEEIKVGNYFYKADISGEIGYILERGSDGEKKYKMLHALGGKNVYYFLTPLKKGRLQTLPIAYDLNRKEWFDMAGSGVRHYADRYDEPFYWEEWPYTFNTSCYRCHVSQLTINHNLKTDTYNTAWAEPGINCETCHGPAEEHIRVCRSVPKGQIPKDLKIIRGGKSFTPDQNNAACAPCHAKMAPLTTMFKPGDRYFDHFTLTTLENEDFYPDGRDLGENYTYTLWRMSPCAKSGKLDCLHCHTSSGRYRFKIEKNANGACLPCHEDRVKNANEHTHHPETSVGNRCVSCHMPMTEFARMRRSDHSMLPPTPSATIKFKSPNACNICHMDKDATWADRFVKKWHKQDYQAPVLHRANLIQAARKKDWKKLPEILAYISSEDRDEVSATSLIRLLCTLDNTDTINVFIKALKDPSPLIRSAAATALSNHLTPEVVNLLCEATRDEYRIVRVNAAASLAGVLPQYFNETNQKSLALAISEFEASMKVRPDDATSHYNLGNLYMGLRLYKQSLTSYKTALKLQPDLFVALVNSAIVYNLLGRNEKAMECFRKALKESPEDEVVNLNLGLLSAEMKQTGEAIKALRTVLKTNPKSAVAAYNLCILLSEINPDESLQFCKIAYEQKLNPKYGYTLAFYQKQFGDKNDAIKILLKVINRQPEYTDAYLLLSILLEQQGKANEAADLFHNALTKVEFPEQVRLRLEARLRALKGKQ